MWSSQACGRYCPLGCRPVRRDRPAAAVAIDLSSRKPDYGTRNRRQEPLAEAGTRTYGTLAACPVGVPRVSQISEWHAYRPRLSAYQLLRSRAYEGHGARFRSPGEVRRSSQTCILRNRARPTSAIAPLPGCENSIGAVDLPDSGGSNVAAAVIARRPQMMIDTASLKNVSYHAVARRNVVAWLLWPGSARPLPTVTVPICLRGEGCAHALEGSCYVRRGST